MGAERTPGDSPPPPQLSPVRVAVLLAVLAALVFGGWQLASKGTPAAEARSGATPVYAPYVDVTLTPTYPFQLPSANPVSRVYLAFVVGDPADACRPSWGGYYTLAEAGRSLDLDARAAQLRDEGGSVTVSFGGRDHTELAVGCTDARKLVNAYRAPLARYHSSAIDLDLEGANLDDRAANGRRARAIATVQREVASSRKPLRVWLTLPVTSRGLTPAGLAAVKAMLAAHVRLAGVNAMAMDFAAGEQRRGNTAGTVESALFATQAQVRRLWRTAGLPSSEASAWGHVGMTVMLGVDDSGAYLTTRGAQRLAAFASRHGIPRVSVWSLNRDAACGGAFARTGILSNTCSGVLQTPLEFTRIFAGLKGTRTASDNVRTPTVPEQQVTAPVDDPARSPYPVWRAAAAYGTGYKVVWQGVIYQSSWWTQGNPPDAAGTQSPGPWQPIGPVPRGSRAPKPQPLVAGTFRSWSPATVYRQGDRVSFRGLPYEARWYTHGDQPLDDLPADPGLPWQPLFKFPGEPTAASTGAGR